MLSPEESQQYVNQLLAEVEILVDDTKKEFLCQPELASFAIRMRWRAIMVVIDEGADELRENDYDRLAESVNDALEGLDTYLLAIQQDVPVESYWSVDELTQFTTKGD